MCTCEIWDIEQIHPVPTEQEPLDRRVVVNHGRLREIIFSKWMLRLEEMREPSSHYYRRYDRQVYLGDLSRSGLSRCFRGRSARTLGRHTTACRAFVRVRSSSLCSLDFSCARTSHPYRSQLPRAHLERNVWGVTRTEL